MKTSFKKAAIAVSSLAFVGGSALPTVYHGTGSFVGTSLVGSQVTPADNIFVDNSVLPIAQGESCAKNVFGVVIKGDASIQTAMSKGKLVKVHSIATKKKSFLTFYRSECTIVSGETSNSRS